MLKRCVFNRLEIGMIPKSYRESLTYEEQILWLQKYLNDMLDWLTKLQEDFDNIDLNFDELEHEISLIKEDIYQINNKITNLSGNILFNFFIIVLQAFFIQEFISCFNFNLCH